ncbi:RNA-binding protein [Candidatus Woesebacteria bacterium]|nr:RNA-binding protein [Candidatus Woesebacteria bacterium]
MNDNAQANPKKLFIGNLPYSATESDITALLSPYGELVEVRLIVDKMSGRSRGIAFAEFATEDSANQAVEALKNYEMDGRAIIVNVARPQQPRENRGGDRGGYGGGGSRGGYGGGQSRGGYGGGRGGDRGGYGRSND